MKKKYLADRLRDHDVQWSKCECLGIATDLENSHDYLLAAAKKAFLFLEGAGRDGSYTNHSDASEALEAAIKNTGKEGEKWLRTR